MNFNITKSSVKGKEVITLTLSPSDNLERVFFNELFPAGSEIEFKPVANSKEEIIICKKGTFVTPEEVKE